MKLSYRGYFELPPGPQPHDRALPPPLRPFAKFGWGGRAMCLRAEDELWISGSDQGDLVASVKIPGIGGVAVTFQPFSEITPRPELAAAKLDQLVGLAQHHGRLWALWQDWYDVDGQDGERRSLWDGEQLRQIGRGELKQHAGYLTAYGELLWCGRSDGAGSADVPHGPALYHLHGRSPQDAVGYFFDARDDWTRADRYTALAFLPGHACWLVRKAVGPVWYGAGALGPNGELDEWESGKGYHTTHRQVWLLPYTFPDLEALPPIVLGEFHASSRSGGMAYDQVSRTLYIHELWPPSNQAGGAYKNESPRIHLWRVEPSEDSPAPPPAESRRVTIEIEGLGMFDGSVKPRRLP